MAGSKSDAWEADILKMVTGQATTIITTTALANVYVALFTVAPSDTGGGTEVTGGSYARVDSKGKWGAPTGTTQVATNAVVTFPQATADWAAGATQIVAFALMTAITAGTMLMWGTLTTAKNVLNGDTPSFASGALVLTED
jgi:hypothetical protein